MIKDNYVKKKKQNSSSSLKKAIYFLVFTNIISLIFLHNAHQPDVPTQGINQRITQEVPSSLHVKTNGKEPSSLGIDERAIAASLEKGKWEEKRVTMPNLSSYSFENPKLAFKVLSELDIFEPVNSSYFGKSPDEEVKPYKPYFGLTNDDNYCTKNRAYFAENPKSVFNEINFITTASRTSLVREIVMPRLGNDIMPHVGSHMPKLEKEDFLYDIRPDAHIFFSSSSMGKYKHIGKHFACLNQATSNIPGHSAFSRKDLAAESAIAYSKQFVSRPQCFNNDKFFPETWLLYDRQSCLNFFEKFNSEEYKKLKAERQIVYIRKVGAGSHRGAGVFPVTDDEEKIIRQEYKNGTLCGKLSANYIVQHYVHDPLLLEGRKFDFRMYMLIASTNPLMAYYHDGFLRVSLGNYESNSTDKKVLLTNLALNKQIYQEVKEGQLFNGMDEEALKIAKQWSFERLQEYLLKTGVISDRKWLDNYLRPEFKKAMIHLIRMASHSFLKRSTIYELYGVDFLLDSNLNLWFIEANSGPAIGGYSKPMEKFIAKMVEDHFEIIMGLIRSRMKRVINYVNRIISSGLVAGGKKDNIKIKDLDQRRYEFKTISKNYFEKEFEPKAGNGFSKIIDDNLFGTERYSGLISQECL